MLAEEPTATGRRLVIIDRLVVKIRVLEMNVAVHEVGLRSSVENTGVGGPSNSIPYRPLAIGYRLTRRSRVAATDR